MRMTRPPGSEWVPESQLRDALISERLPAALRGRTLFWINVRRYLQHEHSRLPAEDYLKHWQQIYRWCVSDDWAALGGLSYVALAEPGSPEKAN